MCKFSNKDKLSDLLNIHSNASGCKGSPLLIQTGGLHHTVFQLFQEAFTSIRCISRVVFLTYKILSSQTKPIAWVCWAGIGTEACLTQAKSTFCIILLKSTYKLQIFLSIAHPQSPFIYNMFPHSRLGFELMDARSWVSS